MTEQLKGKEWEETGERKRRDMSEMEINLGQKHGLSIVMTQPGTKAQEVRVDQTLCVRLCVVSRVTGE